MASKCTGLFFLALLLVAWPPTFGADECDSPSVGGVRLSTSSFRNKTGHWITKASLVRKGTTVVRSLQKDDRPLLYDLDITRRSCGDDESMTVTLSVIAPPPRVGADYKFVPNIGYYKLHSYKVNWEEARRTCEREGAHLAIVNSEEEKNALIEIMKLDTTGVKAFFTGFHDMFEEGKYVTVLGEPLSSTGYVNWMDGEPNNKIKSENPEGEDCGEIRLDGYLNDVRCSITFPFICEQSL